MSERPTQSDKELETLYDSLCEQEAVAGQVYFIQCQQYIKIGLTAGRVDDRLKQMQIGNPYTLTIINTLHAPDVHNDEERLHSHFIRYQHQGEWFKLPSDIVKVIVGADSIGDVMDYPLPSRIPAPQ